MTVTSVSPATTRQTTPRPDGIPVLPSVDLNLGEVTFFTPSGHRAYRSSEPAELITALNQAVRPARWIPERGTLVVTVAQSGVRAGRGLGFRLSSY